MTLIGYLLVEEQVTSTGTTVDWNAHFYRNVYALTSGKGLQLRFKVDITNTVSVLALEANDATYRRFGVVADGGRLYVQYNDGGGYRAPIDLLSTLQVNTWYVLRLVVDDVRGFYVEAYQETAPATRGSYTQVMPTGLTWRFHHWIYRGTAYLDDYREFSTSGLSWTQDERLNFSYDEQDRLLNAWPDSGGQQGYGPQNYRYYPNGNIDSTTGLGTYSYASTCSGGTAHALPHAVASVTAGNIYQYDCNGNTPALALRASAVQV